MTVNSELHFSQVREDPLIEIDVARRVSAARGRPVKVFTIASGGCTAVSLLGVREVEEVWVADPNCGQVHLAELRYVAARRLSPDVQLRFYGMLAATRPQRLGWLAMLAPELSRAAAEYWSARPDEIAFGVNRSGKWEARWRWLARRCDELGLDPVARPMEALSHPRWRALFDVAMRREALAEEFVPAIVGFSEEESYEGHFCEVYSHALRACDGERNYFLTSTFREAYPEAEDERPPYLSRASQGVLRERPAGALRGVVADCASAIEAIAAAGTRFDVIQTSNISDWMSAEDYERTLAIVYEALAPGGAVIARRLNGDYVLAGALGRRFTYDGALSDRLWRGDRSFYYSEIGVAFK